MHPSSIEHMQSWSVTLYRSEPLTINPKTWSGDHLGQISTGLDPRQRSAASYSLTSKVAKGFAYPTCQR